MKNLILSKKGNEKIAYLYNIEDSICYYSKLIQKYSLLENYEKCILLKTVLDKVNKVNNLN